MQSDFHFYCMGVLARAAGFNVKDALTIAYSSQYVDDSTESSLIQLDVDRGVLRFDPVRTAASGLEYRNWSTQKRVFVPFHFIPPKVFLSGQNGAFSFVTRANSPFAAYLLDLAAAEPLSSRKRRLCRIGIALHTLADSWAHQGFSGRRSKTENDVEELAVYDNRECGYRHLRIESLVSDIFVPSIGHAKAGRFADLSFLRWRFRHVTSHRAIVERDNVAVYLEAAKSIYARLRTMEKCNEVSPIPWVELESEIKALLSAPLTIRPGWRDRVLLAASDAYEVDEIEHRSNAWKSVFARLFDPNPEWYHYDRMLWRTWAVQGDTEWDGFSRADWEHADPYVPMPKFWDSLWVHFHRAALRQRHLVLEHLP